jgi:hypothetical protein
LGQGSEWHFRTAFKFGSLEGAHLQVRRIPFHFVIPSGLSPRGICSGISAASCPKSQQGTTTAAHSSPYRASLVYFAPAGVVLLSYR